MLTCIKVIIISSSFLITRISITSTGIINDVVVVVVVAAADDEINHKVLITSITRIPNMVILALWSACAMSSSKLCPCITCSYWYVPLPYTSVCTTVPEPRLTLVFAVSIPRMFVKLLNWFPCASVLFAVPMASLACGPLHAISAMVSSCSRMRMSVE